MFTRGLRLIPAVSLRTRLTEGPTAPAIAEADRHVLREMARHSGWIERGGRAIRAPSKYQAGGDVIGRTQWVGQPQWARGFGYSKADIEAITERGIAGKRLGRKQRLLFQTMRDVLAEADQWTENDS